MVSCNYNFLAVRQRGKPVDLGLYILHRPRIRHITRMYEDISFRDGGLVRVRVGYADNSDCGLVPGRLEWSPAEYEDDGVDEGYKGPERGFEYAVDDAGRIVLQRAGSALSYGGVF